MPALLPILQILGLDFDTNQQKTQTKDDLIDAQSREAADRTPVEDLTRVIALGISTWTDALHLVNNLPLATEEDRTTKDRAPHYIQSLDLGLIPLKTTSKKGADSTSTLQVKPCPYLCNQEIKT